MTVPSVGNMSYLANALSAALENLHWSQTQLADRTGMMRHQINRYCRGRATVAADSLIKLLDAFPDPHNAELLAAYLRDMIPAGFEPLVEVSVNTAAVREEPPSLPEGLDADLRGTLYRLALAGSRHTQVRDMLIQFDKIMRPKM